MLTFSELLPALVRWDLTGSEQALCCLETGSDKGEILSFPSPLLVMTKNEDLQHCPHL